MMRSEFVSDLIQKTNEPLERELRARIFVAEIFRLVLGARREVPMLTMTTSLVETFSFRLSESPLAALVTITRVGEKVEARGLNPKGGQPFVRSWSGDLPGDSSPSAEIWVEEALSWLGEVR